ncbi:uncharacterized protein CTRU02_207704 [Colletotrichum truncatum]|uniref:Uncharacterized protein n=1 Tax=Colletotrichum truncatum TaxID=5467 RepID=A0ACC3Z1K2_COLTU|nr:uncharacterized protein CTRU02_09190 [Colletotrichum truncatum]KAF6788869.1 hypothetical protein CTRU02_09190 [Colletotrichum truncatum]
MKLSTVLIATFAVMAAASPVVPDLYEHPELLQAESSVNNDPGSQLAKRQSYTICGHCYKNIKWCSYCWKNFCHRYTNPC